MALMRHWKLLTDISDAFDFESAEYSNFIEHMKGYVPRGLLNSKTSFLSKIELLATKGHLEPGKYDVLKRIAEDSGNKDIVAMIEATEKDNKMQLVKQDDTKLKRHRLLLQRIADQLDNDSPEYESFIEQMKCYVPRRVLVAKRSLLDKFDALAAAGHLGPGTYDVLKKIFCSSGNTNIMDIILKAETDLRTLKVREMEDAIVPVPKLELADKISPLAGSSETPNAEDVQSDVLKTSDDKSVRQQLIDEVSIKRHGQKKRSMGKKGQRFIYPSLPISLRSSKRKFNDSINPAGTVQTPFKKRRTEVGTIQSKPPFEQTNQRNIDKQWANARKTGEDKARIITICNKVCCDIQNKYSGNMLYVWPAYDSANKDSVQFVIVSKEDSDNIDFDLQYPTVVRKVNTYSKEASVVMVKIEKGKHIMSFEDSEKIKSVINRRAEELLKNHRYLSAISGCGVRSRGFSKGEHELIQEVCIVLYVQTKGKIPLDETEFPKELDSIPVDVMEGEFKTCALPTQFQSNLCMGCQIQSGSFGTLGGFVDHPQYGLSAITCAHVVLDDAELHDLQRDGKITWNSSTKNVYQPDHADENTNYFGKVKEARYKSGGNGTSGVDLAVIEVERRPPINGNCPESNNIQRENLNFETGKVRSALNENNSYVVKFGRTTGETNGFVQFSNAAVRMIDHEHRYQLPDGEHTYRLFNQFEIRSSSGCFVDRGDSGSLVFKKDVSGDFVCIGMVVGHILPSGNGVVIPISAILSELGNRVQGFKDFRLDYQSEFRNRLSRIETTLNDINRRIP